MILRNILSQFFIVKCFSKSLLVRNLVRVILKFIISLSVQVMNESFLPLVGEKQTKFEHEIDKMEVNVDACKSLWLCSIIGQHFVT